MLDIIVEYNDWHGGLVIRSDTFCSTHQCCVTCWPLLPSASVFSPSTASPSCGSSLRGAARSRSPPRPRPPRPLRPPLPRPLPPLSLPGTSMPLSLQNSKHVQCCCLIHQQAICEYHWNNISKNELRCCIRSNTLPVVLLHIPILPVFTYHDLATSQVSAVEGVYGSDSLQFKGVLQ